MYNWGHLTELLAKLLYEVASRASKRWKTRENQKPVGRICAWGANGTLSQLEPPPDLQQNSICAHEDLPFSLCSTGHSVASPWSGFLVLTSLLCPTACSTFDLLCFSTLTSGWVSVAMTTSPWFWLSLASGHSVCTNTQPAAQSLALDSFPVSFVHLLQASKFKPNLLGFTHWNQRSRRKVPKISWMI